MIFWCVTNFCSSFCFNFLLIIRTTNKSTPTPAIPNTPYLSTTNNLYNHQQLPIGLYTHIGHERDMGKWSFNSKFTNFEPPPPHNYPHYYQPSPQMAQWMHQPPFDHWCTLMRRRRERFVLLVLYQHSILYSTLLYSTLSTAQLTIQIMVFFSQLHFEFNILWDKSANNWENLRIL